jgi:hypothetical protein
VRGLLKTARLAVAGQVTSVTPYDDDRVAVVDFTVDQVLKGSLPGTPPLHVALVEMHEGPARPPLTVGTRGIAFLRPAARTSYLAKFLPAGSYYELLPEYGSFIAAASPADATQQSAALAPLIAAARGQAMDAGAARRLTFDLLACKSPLLVDDAAHGVAELQQPPPLTAAEQSTLRDALLRTDLPDPVRIALIQSVAAARLTDAVPTLQRIEAPSAVAEAAWQALDRLGAGPPEKSLDAWLASTDPAIRAAAVREVLRRDGVAAVSKVAPVAIQDPDQATRKAAVEALGALGKPEVLPPLERVFVIGPTDLQQAAARAIQAVGGQAAAEACWRLAFVGSADSQRYAVVVLMTMNDPHKEAVLQRIAATHPDEKIRDLIANGIPYHEH